MFDVGVQSIHVLYEVVFPGLSAVLIVITIGPLLSQAVYTCVTIQSYIYSRYLPNVNLRAVSSSQNMSNDGIFIFVLTRRATTPPIVPTLFSLFLNFTYLRTH